MHWKTIVINLISPSVKALGLVVSLAILDSMLYVNDNLYAGKKSS